ncbi:MAG: 3-dehydroquinate synthase II [Candidatus Bathyarchaeia archaeon]
MRELWLRIEPTLPDEVKSSLAEAAKKANATILADKTDVARFKALGLRVAAPSGDIEVLEEIQPAKIKQIKEEDGNVAVRVSVGELGDEAKVVKAAELGADVIIVKCTNWRIIPLENLIAKVHGKSKLLAVVSNAAEAKTALETLELGADGIVLETRYPRDVQAVTQVASTVATRLEEKAHVAGLPLHTARVVAKRDAGVGARVCVDSCDLMVEGEGMLVGSQSAGLFLIQAEIQVNPHVEPRPFRVNAGPVALYILTPGNKTKYLAELKAGDAVNIVNRHGNVRQSTVGRMKIEQRPLTLVEADVDGYIMRTIVQNAETIRFVTKDGSISIADLKLGDEVLVYHQSGGRHFGTLVKEETVIET